MEEPLSVDLIRAAISGENGDDQRRIAEVGVDWIVTLLRKNRDYGSSAWKVPVLAPGLDIGVAIRVRMSDKIERIQSLLKNGKAEVVDEAIEDTIKDLGAYALLLLARPKEPHGN